MSLYFLDASQQSPTERLRTGIGPEQPPTHIRNPIIILAILGAIASSLLLAGAALVFRFYKFSEVSQIAQDEIVKQADDQAVDTPTIQRRNALPSPTELGSVPVPRSLMAGPTHTEIEPNVDIPPIQADELQKIETRREKVQKEIRRADEELARLNEQQNQKATKQKEDFGGKWATERAEREERMLKAKQLKLQLKRMEVEAENNPLQGLIVRIPIDGWGVNSLAINNKSQVFLGMNEGIQVYDWKRKKNHFNDSSL